MLNQRLYTNVKLGNSNYTIATDGCYLVSIHDGLDSAGYNFTIQQLNQLFKDRGVFAQGSGLLGASTIAAKVGDIFLEGRNEAWNDAKLIAYLKDPSYFVIGEVSGKGIGGSFQHFVRIISVDVKSDGKISMTYINDPWDGLHNQKVTTRYNNYGNILSLRVFKIKKVGGDMANYYPTTGDLKIDLNNPAAVKAAVDTWVKVASGQTVDKPVHEKALSDLKAKMDGEKKNEYTKGKSDLITSITRELKLPEDTKTQDQLIEAILGLIHQSNSGEDQNSSQPMSPPKLLKLADGDVVKRNGVKWLPGGELEASYQEIE